jgi:hypothetical protein
MSAAHTGDGTEVMAALDESSSEFVIADVGRDDAWVSTCARDAVTLENWC